MSTAASESSTPREKDPNLPALARLGDVVVPRAPQTIQAVGLADGELTNHLLRLAYTVPRFTTDWAGKQLQLSPTLTSELLTKVCYEGDIEQLWQTSETSSHYKIADQGRERAQRLVEVCAYV